MISRLRQGILIALLLVGSAVPLIGQAHWEGVEAADPATPAALLGLESAIAGYVEAGSDRTSWRERFANDPGAGDPHAGHTGAAETTPATTER
ncbi:MAG: hypothetical protein ACR2QQ_07705 [Gammaproteobacteria bacterium]